MVSTSVTIPKPWRIAGATCTLKFLNRVEAVSRACRPQGTAFSCRRALFVPVSCWWITERPTESLGREREARACPSGLEGGRRGSPKSEEIRSVSLVPLGWRMEPAAI